MTLKFDNQASFVNIIVLYNSVNNYIDKNK